MNHLATADIIAYLLVLNYTPVLKRLSASERRIGQQNIMGCYCRLMESLEDQISGDFCKKRLYQAIQYREHLNAVEWLPCSNFQFQQATAEVAEMLYRHLKMPTVSNDIKNAFLKRLDCEIEKILE